MGSVLIFPGEGIQGNCKDFVLTRGLSHRIFLPWTLLRSGTNYFFSVCEQRLKVAKVV